MNLMLGEEQMRAVVTKAIVEGLGEEQKTIILTQAVQGLMKPANPDRYNDKTTVIEKAFQQAASFALDRLAREEFEKPENKERIRSLFEDVVVKALEGDARGSLVIAIANALAEGMAKSRY